jgi:hypothetical protein
MSIDLDAMGLGNLGNRFVVDRGGDPQLLAATVLHKIIGWNDERGEGPRLLVLQMTPGGAKELAAAGESWTVRSRYSC